MTFTMGDVKVSSPCTPRKRCPSKPQWTPPALNLEKTSLLRSLRSCSEAHVREALEEEGLATTFCNGEPYLCTALRYGCSEGVVKLLMEHKADVNEENFSGQTALGLLCSTPLLHVTGWSFDEQCPFKAPAGQLPAALPVQSWAQPAYKASTLDLEGEAADLGIAALLLDAGACTCAKDGTALDGLALQSGRPRLARLLQRHQEAQARVAFHGANTSLKRLPSEIEAMICKT
mmetsp:Transcript_72846/g.158123  ORF Transcript_72846/g.158123 Transcript_72846/m.158123 type:complete len:232 (+) Transcript_72846:43-738(+)|eukprot:CAMPEP_0170602274 /NCGR_PEP_ID=MMETSP0224-20130122/18303_1 /TAXON_ID=285029 /ORGANISM="Togula jolla, Strain CCCM 725" /LENGTH=231 /DNA_ID=CAMNT_0010927101 /DNA_START=38 /DNA_END=733 /DNA_ORIENTATION=+